MYYAQHVLTYSYSNPLTGIEPSKELEWDIPLVGQVEQLHSVNDLLRRDLQDHNSESHKMPKIQEKCCKLITIASA